MLKFIRYTKILGLAGAATLLLAGCADNFLDIGPKGVLTEDQLTEPEHIDGFIVAAYAWIPSAGALNAPMNPWITSFPSMMPTRRAEGWTIRPPGIRCSSYPR